MPCIDHRKPLLFGCFQQAPGAKLRESIDIGVFNGTGKDLTIILDDLRTRFSGSDYNLLNRNCNSFAQEFIQRLTGKDIPPFVNRMATIGSYFSCLLPQSLTGEAPVTDSGGQSSSGSSYSTATSVKPAPFVGSGIKLGASQRC